MNKKIVGETLSVIGIPFELSALFLISSVGASAFRFLSSIPLVLITLPFAPFALLADKILVECNKEEFVKQTSHLPKITLPEHHAYIDNDRKDVPEIWYAIIDYSDGFYECESEQKAKELLTSKGYQEVVALNYPDSLNTYWVKNET